MLFRGIKTQRVAEFPHYRGIKRKQGRGERKEQRNQFLFVFRVIKQKKELKVLLVLNVNFKAI